MYTVHACTRTRLSTRIAKQFLILFLFIYFSISFVLVHNLSLSFSPFLCRKYFMWVLAYRWHSFSIQLKSPVLICVVFFLFSRFLCNFVTIIMKELTVNVIKSTHIFLNQWHSLFNHVTINKAIEKLVGTESICCKLQIMCRCKDLSFHNVYLLAFITTLSSSPSLSLYFHICGVVICVGNM